MVILYFSLHPRTWAFSYNLCVVDLFKLYCLSSGGAYGAAFNDPDAPFHSAGPNMYGDGYGNSQVYLWVC